MKKITTLLLNLILILFISKISYSVTYYVNDSSGTNITGSFLRAVSDANNNPGFDTIVFNLPIGQRTIALQQVANITDSTGGGGVLILGDIDNNGTPDIELRANGVLSQGININSDNNIIKGLIINGFQYGIRILSGRNNLIIGNYIGTDKTGMIAKPNISEGILIQNCGKNQVGDGTLAGRNIISGNTGNGININNSDTISILGNYIGVDATGNNILANTANGIRIELTSDYVKVGDTLAGFGNTISGNATAVRITDTCTFISISNNFIGTNSAGTLAIPNGVGVMIENNAVNITVGQATTFGRNVISGNVLPGIDIGISSTPNAIRNIQILNNIVGLDASGTFAIPNTNYGIRINGSGREIKIGDGTSAGRNVISSNQQSGMFLFSNNGITNPLGKIAILGNYVGTDITGNVAIGNSTTGIYIQDNDSASIDSIMIGDGTVSGKNVVSGNGSDGIYIGGNATKLAGPSFVSVNNNLIGGSNLGNNSVGLALGSGVKNAKIEFNIIAYNGASGIQVSDDSTKKNIFYKNIIHSNGVKGINIVSNAQESVKPPKIDSFVISTPLLYGSASPNARIQIYTDNIGGGQGRTFLDTIQADVSGQWQYTLSLPPYGREVTALQDSANNTSAFSLPFSGFLNISGTIFNGIATDTVLSGKAFLYVNINGQDGSYILSDSSTLNTSNPKGYQFGPIFQGNYIINVVPNQTAYPNTLATYHTAAIRWFDADVLNIVKDTVLDITLPVVTPLTGLGTIKGRVVQGTNSSFKIQGPGDPFNGIDVSLIDKSTGSAIAFTKTDTITTPGIGGKFQFDNVPNGTYILHVDVAGIPIDTNTKYTIDGANTLIDKVLVSADSNFISFGVEAGINNVLNNNTFDIYPNPANDFVYVNYKVTKNDYIKIKVLDISGQLIKEIAYDRSAGVYLEKINLSHFTAGLYFIQVSNAKGELNTRKIVVE